jgi:hypothetical protein
MGHESFFSIRFRPTEYIGQSNVKDGGIDEGDWVRPDRGHRQGAVIG